MVFKTPIDCLDTKVVKKLSSSVMKDMSVVDVYGELFGGRESVISSGVADSYSTSRSFLKDTSKFLKKCRKPTIDSTSLLSMNKKLIGFLSNQPTWKHDYKFITFDKFENLNRNAKVQQIYSLTQIGTPAFNLTLPIFFVILPFLLIKFVMREKVSLDLYLKLLKQQFYKKIFGRNFTSLSSANFAYVAFSIFFYFFNIYSSFISCKKYITNFIKIRTFIEDLESYMKGLLSSIQHYLEISRKIKTYRKIGYVLQLEQMYSQVDNVISSIPIKPSFTFTFIWNIGNTMKELYEWFSIHVEMLVRFSRFHHYHIIVERIVGMDKHLSRARFVLNNSREKIVDFIHPLLVREKSPKYNTLNSNTHIILTGENASGKTTTMKSLFLNHLLSQQFGIGFYKKANIHIYETFNSYINIPDTNERESLFQKEIGRCKEICDVIEDGKLHYCIFDELFSGTNPEEAISSGIGFIRYLVNKGNIHFILSTHFREMCFYLKDDKSLSFKQMKDEYSIEDGISSTYGGLKVLKNSNMPESIIQESVRYFRKKKLLN
jgi:hypothetical protein